MQADRSVERRMAELAGRAARTGATQMAWFLSPAEQAQAEICARAAGVGLYACGGPEDAERRVVAFSDEEEAPDWPIDCLAVSWQPRYGAPGHRDMLGSLTGMGIGREQLGDIYIGEGVAHVFALRGMARYIAGGLTQVGRVPVRVALLEAWPALAAGDGEPIRKTVASLRLDALVGATWNLSRTRAAELVASGRVQVDHQETLRPDRQLGEGAVISVRGMGRARLAHVGGQTKKGRIGVELLRY